MHIVHLLAAIVAETVGTTALHASQQFSRPVPSILAVASYGLSIYLLSLTLKVLPVGVVYAVWSGLGIVSIALIGVVAFGRRLDPAAVLGIAMILAGMVIIQVFSGATPH